MFKFLTSFGKKGGGCGCLTPKPLVGGWKHSSRASLASNKRLSMRISKTRKRRGTTRRGTTRRNSKRRNTKRRNTKRRGTKRRGTKRRRHKR